ncbi:flavodoxin family protein [Dongia sp.]|uniref:flavodoxin family protein n=1 Tax=Dongia sp. TaxID=1977262 RepID=UPI003751C233
MAERDTQPRKGMPDPKLGRDEFTQRFLTQFRDPAFRRLDGALDEVAAVAWEAYHQGRKAPITRKAGPAFADPEYDLAQDWLDARDAIAAAQARHDDPAAQTRLLVINGASRSEHTCPGEMSKTWRLVEIASAAAVAEGTEVELLDLSRLSSEYGRKIYPCKTCFSTAAPLCHWPCSCYPNHALGQTQDWMNAIYPMWVAAHGVMIVTPVNWYHASSALKLMIDRLVCADGGNADPTRTHGKDAAAAKKIELAGWDYPRHLAGRVYSVIVHGDAEGVTEVRRALSDWLSSMELMRARDVAHLERYIGYWQPYATNHGELDRDRAIQQEVEIAARALARDAQRARTTAPSEYTDLKEPREK